GPEGNVYVSAPGSGMEFWRSTDQGKTFTQGSSPESPSGDTSVNVDSSGAVYETNLHVISGTNTLQVDVFKSFDFGATWPQKGTSTLESSNSSGQPLLVDRQWVDAYIPPGKTTDQAQVYLTYHDFGPGTMWVSSSSDGGKTFGPPMDIINDPVAAADSFCNTIPGSVKVVPSGPHAGRVYVAWLAADPANPATGCNETQLAAFHTVWIAYSDDNGATWKDQLVFDGGLLHDGSEIFADMTLDNQGNPYVAFSMNLKDEFDVWVEASFDGGQTWNGKSDGTGQPYQANVDTGTHYFASISAGNPGQIDVAFIRTDMIVGTLPNGKPDPSTDSTASWNVYAAQSKTLLSGTPKFKVVKLSTSPMHVGDVCTLGLFCAAVPGTNRDILDFIDVAVDHSGLFHVAYTDDNNYAAGALVMANQVAGPTVGSGGH
ncbi:MAG TPA: sialidase family protein, partial [Actinomycetota bacterium]|nr:sialidase family protein [Actinomycetota bacterium]